MKAWIARDKGGFLWLYFEEEPWKEHEIWTNYNSCAELDPNRFPSVKWEDKEPTEVEVTIKLKGDEK